MKLADHFHPVPPTMQPMQREARAGSQGHYDSQGRYCAPQTEISFSALESNVSMLNAHQQTQWSEHAETMRLIDEKFEELERRIKDAMSLMHYTIQFHPQVVADWQTVDKAKVRIGVDNEQVLSAADKDKLLGLTP